MGAENTPDHIDGSLAAYRRNVQGGGRGFEVLVGMVGSGKSTYARLRAARGAVVVCHDDILRTIRPGKEYNSGLAEMFHRIERDLIRAATAFDCRVVIDRTNLTHASRDRWLEMASDLGVPVVAVRFPMADPDEHARRRFDADPRGLTLDQWKRIASDHRAQADRSPLCESVLGYRKVVDLKAIPDPDFDPLD